MKLKEAFNQKLRSEFIEEAKEIANDFEEILLKLDREGVDSDPGAVGTLFRYYHTIKGSSYTVGFDKIGHFVHKIENLLSDMRDGRLELNEDIIEMLLSSNDTLKNHLNSQVGDIESILPEEDGLSALSQKEASSPKKDSGLHLFDDEEQGIEQNSEKDKKYQCIEKTIDKPSQNKIATNINFLALGFENITVMICDDDEDIRFFIKQILESAGFKTVSVANGQDALDELKKKSVDVILMDIKMPVMDGVTFAKKLRFHDRETSLIMISGQATNQDLSTLLNVGANGFIVKPFDRDSLLLTVHSGLKQKITRNAIIHISDVSYQAYMLFSKFQTQLDQGILPDEKARKKLTQYMDEIAYCVNKVLDT